MPSILDDNQKKKALSTLGELLDLTRRPRRSKDAQPGVEGRDPNEYQDPDKIHALLATLVHKDLQCETPAEFARNAGISWVTVDRWLNKGSIPRPSNIVAIVQVIQNGTWEPIRRSRSSACSPWQI
jgi:hypothetical protein